MLDAVKLTVVFALDSGRNGAPEKLRLPLAGQLGPPLEPLVELAPEPTAPRQIGFADESVAGWRFHDDGNARVPEVRQTSVEPPDDAVTVAPIPEPVRRPEPIEKLAFEKVTDPVSVWQLIARLGTPKSTEPHAALNERSLFDPAADSSAASNEPAGHAADPELSAGDADKIVDASRVTPGGDVVDGGPPATAVGALVDVVDEKAVIDDAEPTTTGIASVAESTGCAPSVTVTVTGATPLRSGAVNVIVEDGPDVVADPTDPVGDDQVKW
jgi:hypothetical protein